MPVGKQFAFYWIDMHELVTATSKRSYVTDLFCDKYILRLDDAIRIP
jgi:hypothetical protein